MFKHQNRSGFKVNFFNLLVYYLQYSCKSFFRFSYNLEVPFILGSFLFISVTSRLNLPHTILSTGLNAFEYDDVVLLILSRPSSLIKS